MFSASSNEILNPRPSVGLQEDKLSLGYENDAYEEGESSDVKPITWLKPKLLQPIDGEQNESSVASDRSVSRGSAPTPGSRTGTPMLDQTISAAFRNRIRSKIKQTKKNVKQSSIDNEISREDAIINSQLSKKIERKGTWKVELSKIIQPRVDIERKAWPTVQESYEFFTKTYPNVRLCEKSSKGECSGAAAEDLSLSTPPPNSDDLEENETEKLATADIELGKPLYERIPAQKFQKERLEKEKKLLFYPMNKTLPESVESIWESCNEDGMYLGNMLSQNARLSDSNLRRIKERLYRENNRNWLETFKRFYLNDPWRSSESLESIVVDNMRFVDDQLYKHQLQLTRQEVIDEFSKSNVAKYRLIIHIGYIRFSQHRLSSSEHELANQLIGHFERYEHYLEDGVVQNLTQRLSSLRTSLNSLLSKLESQNGEISASEHQRLVFYKETGLQILRDRSTHLKEFRTALMSALTCWQDLKNLRVQQGYSSTTIQLSFDETDKSEEEVEEKEILERMIEDALHFQIDLAKKVYDVEVSEYRKKLRNWKQWQRTQRRASKNDLNSVEERDDIQEPTKPTMDLNIVEITEKIRSETLLVDGRLPGEPQFYNLQLHYTGLPSPTVECSLEERKRRREVKKLRFHIEVCKNGQSLAKTEERNVNFNFHVIFNQVLVVDLMRIVEDLTVNIWQKSTKNELIAGVKLTLPDSSAVQTDNFSIKDSPLPFGSPDDLKDSGQKMQIEGFLCCSVSWGKNGSGVVLSPALPYDKNDSFDLTLNGSNNKPSILSNSSLGDSNAALGNSSAKTLLWSDELQFCSKEEVENSPRIKMLMMRSQGAPHLKNVQVPLYDREVSLQLLETKATKFVFNTMENVETKRVKAMEVLEQIREKLLKQSQEGTAGRRKTWEDMIYEEESSKWSLAFSFFSSTDQRRPLHPLRKERKKVSGSVPSNGDIKLIITIMHAFNVPVRIQNSREDSNVPQASAESELEAIAAETRVSPFIEACFQRETARTSTADGPKPTWNETLTLNFKAPNNDLSATSITKVADNVYLNLFDEVITGDQNHERLERRWLGSLRIPFSTIYLNLKIEGTFCLNKPPILLGYEYDSRFLNSESSQESNLSDCTYMTLFMTIDPGLQLPEPLHLKCDSNEEEDVLNHAKKWESEMKAKYPDRVFKALTIDLEGKFVVVTRYLQSTKPPEELLYNLPKSEEVMQRLARFVSLIPFVSDNIALPGFGDIWCTCPEFLSMQIGDEEEHAILLCNFFLYLGKQCGILLGFGIPEGLTAYVIVWDYAGIEPSLWNPSTGQRFSVRDSYLPLHSVGCIFTRENVYANVQKHVHPNHLNYDVTKSSNWQHLFTKKFPFPNLQSVQPESLEYGTINQNYVEELEAKLEKHLKDCLMRWRKKSRTFFNRKCIQQIRKILPRLEKKIGRLQQSDLIQDLHDVLTVHQMTGFPLNMPFTDINSITEAVYATGVHLIDDKKVDFVLTVYIHPYPSNILSVWVYIAALFKI